MAKFLKGFHPNRKIHKVCADDELRPIFGYLYFKDGNVYATDSHIVIAAQLSTISNFTDEEKELLEGKLIHATQFAKLLTMRNVDIELVGGKLCFYCTTQAGETVIIPLLDEETIGKFPNVEAILEQARTNAKENKQPISYVGFKPSLLANLASAMDAKIVNLYFSDAVHAIIVQDPDISNEIRALIMPCLVENPNF